VITTVSSGSTAVSLTGVTVIVAVAAPAGIVTLPASAIKSLPGVAEPATV
jgi:hypothetical protein